MMKKNKIPCWFYIKGFIFCIFFQFHLVSANKLAFEKKILTTDQSSFTEDTILFKNLDKIFVKNGAIIVEYKSYQNALNEKNYKITNKTKRNFSKKKIATGKKIATKKIKLKCKIDSKIYTINNQNQKSYQLLFLLENSLSITPQRNDLNIIFTESVNHTILNYFKFLLIISILCIPFFKKFSNSDFFNRPPPFLVRLFS